MTDEGPVRQLRQYATRPVWLAIAASFALLSVLAGAYHRSLLAVDEPLSESIRGNSLVGFWTAVTHIGETWVAIAVAAAFAVVTWRRCRRFALVYPATMLLGSGVNNVLKLAVDRPRPPRPLTEVTLASFPSGHTVQATVLLGLLPMATYLIATRRTLYGVTVAASAVGILAVGYSRIYLGAHWPTDVIGGIAVGATFVAAAEWIVSRPGAHRRCRCVLAPAERRLAAGADVRQRG